MWQGTIAARCPSMSTRTAIITVASGQHTTLYTASVAAVTPKQARRWISPPRLSLTIDQLTQKLLLENPRCRGWVKTSDARAWVRNKLMQRGVTDVAGAVLKAVRGMAEAGVLKK